MRIVGRSTVLGRLLRSARLCARPMGIHDVLHLETLRRGSLRFIQIGSNNGEDADPLAPFIAAYGWEGVMVEPQPQVFARELAPRHEDNPRIQLINAAIGQAECTATLWTVSFSSKRWATGKASMDREVLLRSLRSPAVRRAAERAGDSYPAHPDEWVEAIEVPTMTVTSLLERTGTTQVDLVHVDTEGRDGEIVRQFDFDLIDARVVVFEHANLTDDDLARTCRHLTRFGFELAYDKMDVLARRRVLMPRSRLTPLEAPWAKYTV